MKVILFLTTGILATTLATAQQDSTHSPKTDTLHIGSMIIIKRPGKILGEHKPAPQKPAKTDNVTTNWMVLDLGVSQFTDNTNYSSSAIQNPFTGFAPGSSQDWFKLRNNKSVNVNIWFFLQKIALIKKESPVVSLKYGLGLELNNYRYSRPIWFETSPTRVVQRIPVSQYTYSKNKLAADYLTVPLMLHVNLTPKKKKDGFGFSAGVSAGYLYSSRHKTITNTEGKQKTRDDFDLRPWKLAYTGELQLGPIKLYGSVATQSMFRKGLDHTPYQVGFRFSYW